MKLSNTEAEILGHLVANAGPGMYGMAMVKASHGRLKQGSIYVLLSRLEDKGFVESERVEDGHPIPRRVYKASGAGKHVFSAWEAMQSALAGVPVGT